MVALAKPTRNPGTKGCWNCPPQSLGLHSLVSASHGEWVILETRWPWWRWLSATVPPEESAAGSACLSVPSSWGSKSLPPRSTQEAQCPVHSTPPPFSLQTFPLFLWLHGGWGGTCAFSSVWNDHGLPLSPFDLNIFSFSLWLMPNAKASWRVPSLCWEELVATSFLLSMRLAYTHHLISSGLDAKMNTMQPLPCDLLRRHRFPCAPAARMLFFITASTTHLIYLSAWSLLFLHLFDKY